MVVDHDPDEAPTADYDPRNPQGYDPRARGVYNSAISANPVIPAAPAAPRFDEHLTGAASSDADDEEAPATVQNPPMRARSAPARTSVPEARPSEGRRRTSRRTVKIPDDPVKRRQLDAEARLLDATREARGDEGGAAEGADVSDLDFSDEITIVKPLRIISVGESPATHVRSPHATWPPSAGSVEGLRPGARELESAQLLANPLAASPIGEAAVTSPTAQAEPGWTPAAPPVAPAAGPPAGEALHTPAPAEPSPALQPRAEPALDAPSISVEPAPTHDLLEEIEPDVHVEVEVEPVRAPPPPPKRKPSQPAPDAASAKKDRAQRGRPWWDEVFSDEYIRTMDRLEPKVAKREVDFIEESLGLEQHAVVLDLACGMGEITTEMAARGYGVVGLDYSAGMLARAQANAKARVRENPEYRPPSFVQADMRELAYVEEFDGIYCWSTSFGYFDDETNAQLLGQLNRALRHGGLLMIDLINRDYIAPRTPSLVWFEGEAAVCMDDVHIDFLTSRMKVKRTAMFEGGSSRELEYSIRLYTLHELGKLLHDAGFKVLEVTGHPAHRGVFFGAESPRVIVLAEKDA